MLHPELLQGWDIKRPTSCNKKPLLSKDSPMQATWIRMQLGKPDNIQVFRPFQYGPLSKVKFFNDMMIGLDTPRYDTTPRRGFPHRPTAWLDTSVLSSTQLDCLVTWLAASWLATSWLVISGPTTRFACAATRLARSTHNLPCKICTAIQFATSVYN